MTIAVAGTEFLEMRLILRIEGRREVEVNSANMRPVVYRALLQDEAAAVKTGSSCYFSYKLTKLQS